jgi:hypothetical protein
VFIFIQNFSFWDSCDDEHVDPVPELREVAESSGTEEEVSNIRKIDPEARNRYIGIQIMI